MIKNKKGAVSAYGSDLAWGVIIFVIFLIFLFGGGFTTLLKITQTLKSIPSFIWIFLGIIILIKLLGGKK